MTRGKRIGVVYFFYRHWEDMDNERRLNFGCLLMSFFVFDILALHHRFVGIVDIAWGCLFWYGYGTVSGRKTWDKQYENSSFSSFVFPQKARMKSPTTHGRRSRGTIVGKSIKSCSHTPVAMVISLQTFCVQVTTALAHEVLLQTECHDGSGF